MAVGSVHAVDAYHAYLPVLDDAAVYITPLDLLDRYSTVQRYADTQSSATTTGSTFAISSSTYSTKTG